MEWCPCKVLEIAHLSQCAGIAATTGRRCGIRVSARKMEAAENLLDEMSFHPISDEGVMSKLMESLAPHLLCSQWHEDQASRLIERWKVRILNSRKAEVMQEMQASSRELEDITAKLGRASLAGAQPLPTPDRTATSNPVTLPRERSSAPGDATTRPRESVTLPREGSSAPGAAIPRFKVSGISFGCIDDFQIPSPNLGSPTPQYQSRHEKSKAPTPSTDKAFSRQTSVSPDIKKDCPICLEPAKSDRLSVTRCPGCLEVFHGSCVNLWSRECVTNGGNPTCPFW